ncbi:MAG: polysaccharide biosynthesis tyrosine autokinase [Bacteroidota bacterium]|nr:polysaccharide biosynthesis tyrosine autokinase [Bacteroidota bacterium]
MPRKKITPLNEEFDFKLFVTIAKKNAIWFGIFMFVSVMFAFLYLRYTAPIYEAASVIKLSEENNAGMLLGKQENMFNDNTNQIAGDVELIRSKIIAQRAIENLDLKISYFAKGTVLDYELYTGSPFSVQVNIKDSSIYQKPFFLEFEDINTFTLRYTYQGEKQELSNNKIKQWIILPFADFKIDIRDFDNISFQQKQFAQNAYYFMINNQMLIINKIVKELYILPLNYDAKTIIVKLKEKNANKAADIINNIVSEFIAYDVEKKSEAANNILSFIDTTLLQVNNSLSESEDRLEKFKTDNRLFDPDLELQEVSVKMSSLEDKFAEVNFELFLIEKLRKEVSENKDVNNYLLQLIGLNEEGKVNAAFEGLQKLLSERDQLLLQSTDQTEIYKMYEQKIGTQKELLVIVIKNEEEVLREKLLNIKSQLATNDVKFGGLPQKQAEFGRLSRVYGINDKFYGLLLEKKAEFSITRAGFVPKNIVLESAYASSFPISPNRPLVISASLIIGFVLSFLLIVIRYLLHDEIGTLEDIEPYSDAALLGIVPKYKREIPISQLLVDKNPKSVIAESFRSIRTNLQFISNEDTAKVIAVTSTISGEGKTFNAINLAGVIAFSGRKVVILDLDMRKPKIHLGFNVENNKGISTILIGKDNFEDCVIKSSLENLEFITAGPIPPNPSELIISPKMDILLEDLKKIYDIIIIDTPPVGVVSDGIPIIKKADYPLYILRANYSRKMFINNINKLMDDSKVSKLALILNGVDLSRLKYGYGYNYSYGYGYGYGYTYGYGYYEEDQKDPTIFDNLKGIFIRTKKKHQ